MMSINSNNPKDITMGNQQERPFNYLELQKEEVFKLYAEKKSLRAIAKILDVSFSGIRNILKKYNIPRRNKCESLNLCPENFTDEEYQIVIGTALGDGHLTKPKKNGESQLYLGHSIKQKDYIQWKYNKLKRFIGCKIYSLFHKLKYKNEIKEFETLNFLTRKSPLFTNLEQIFYPRDRRIKLRLFPYDFLKKNLTPLSLAVWYMDDGYSRYGFILQTQSFSYKDNLVILQLLKEKFDLDGKTKKVKNDKYIVTFGAEQKRKLKPIVEKHMIPSMMYKIKRNPQRLIRQT